MSGDAMETPLTQKAIAAQKQEERMRNGVMTDFDFLMVFQVLPDPEVAPWKVIRRSELKHLPAGMTSDVRWNGDSRRTQFTVQYSSSSRDGCVGMFFYCRVEAGKFVNLISFVN